MPSSPIFYSYDAKPVEIFSDSYRAWIYGYWSSQNDDKSLEKVNSIIEWICHSFKPCIAQKLYGIRMTIDSPICYHKSRGSAAFSSRQQRCRGLRNISRNSTYIVTVRMFILICDQQQVQNMPEDGNYVRFVYLPDTYLCKHSYYNRKDDNVEKRISRYSLSLKISIGFYKSLSNFSGEYRKTKVLYVSEVRLFGCGSEKPFRRNGSYTLWRKTTYNDGYVLNIWNRVSSKRLRNRGPPWMKFGKS